MFMQGIDNAVVHFFQTVGSNPVLDALVPVYSMMGNLGMIWIAIALLMMARKDTRIWGFAALLALGFTCLLDQFVLKSLVMRPRPFVADPSVHILIPEPYGSSFPSAHSGTAFAFAICLLFSSIRKSFKSIIVVLAVLMAFSRAYLCVHYLSDVLVGALTGILVGVLFGLAARAFIRRRENMLRPVIVERGEK